MASSRLTRSNRAGWAFAMPGFGLIALFIVVPFFFAFCAVADQPATDLAQSDGICRPVQLPQPAEHRRADDRTGPRRGRRGDPRRQRCAGISERVRTFTRNNPDYPQYAGMQEWFRWQSGDNAKVVVARDVVFWKSLRNTLLFVLVVAPVQGGLALCLALLINQRLRGINVYRAIYFMPVVVSIVVVSLLWRFIYDGEDGLLNNLLSRADLRDVRGARLAGQCQHGAGRDHGDVDLAGGRVPHGDLAVGPANHQPDPVRGRRHRRVAASGRHSATSPGRGCATPPFWC